MALNVKAKTQASFRAAAKRIKVASRNLGVSTGQGLRMIGEEIMTDVKASRPGAGVPRDTGALAGTGRVEGPVPTPFGPVVELSFGGAAAPYALPQHEILTYRHKVGEARYLVRGMERWKPGGSAAMDALRENAAAGLAAAGRGA
jgi:hypothetical protein